MPPTAQPGGRDRNVFPSVDGHADPPLAKVAGVASDAACSTYASFPAAARRPFGIDRAFAAGKPYVVHERELATLDFSILTQFRRRSMPSDCPGQALVVAPMAGGFPVLMRDLLVGLLGYWPRVSITEWPDARFLPPAKGRFGLAENIAQTVAMIERCGAGVHLFGVCQGAVVALAATAILAARESAQVPRSLILMGGPIAPLANPTRVVRLARSKPLAWFESFMEAVPAGLPGEGRLTYPAKTQALIASAYAWRHILSGGEVFRKLVDDDGCDPEGFPFAELFFSLMDLPAELFLDSILHIYQENDVFTGGVRIGSRAIDLSAISGTALVTVEGDRDDIAAPGQTDAAHGLCGSVPEGRREHLLVEGSGHFSLFHGTLVRLQILPRVSEFLRIAG